MMRWPHLALVALALCAVTASPVRAETPDDGESDPLALAALLLRDGHPERALTTLAAVSPTQEGLDLPRYHQLTGLAALQSGDPARAAAAFDQALAVGPPEPHILVLLAQARFALSDWQGTVDALTAAGDAALAAPGLELLLAQALWRLDRLSDAYDALAAAAERHPALPELTRQRVLLLVDMGLYRAAADLGRSWLDRPDASASDHAAIAEALRRSRSFDTAELILQEALFRWPDDRDLALQLARTLVDAQKPRAAASILERQSLVHPDLRADAAELYRKAGEPYRALRLNALIEDQPRKLRQRLGILVDLERFEEVSALGPRLSRLGLLGDEALRYALAYAAFRTGQFDAADEALRGIGDPELFGKATALRQAMDACRADPEACP
jgi:tetratricopeptide (TPR) repeat protein